MNSLSHMSGYTLLLQDEICNPQWFHLPDVSLRTPIYTLLFSFLWEEWTSPMFHSSLVRRSLLSLLLSILDSRVPLQYC